MNLHNRILPIAAFALLLFTSTNSVSAQAAEAKPAEAAYEAVLHVLIAGGQSGGSVPSSLSAVSKSIRSEFDTSNLRLINTYFGRLSNTGSIDYRGISNAYAAESMPGAPSFLDWRLAGVRSIQDPSGQPAFHVGSFRFGARVPIRMAIYSDEKNPAPVNYESIGLTVDRVSVRENTPALIGTLNQPRTDGTLFLVLTIRNADK
ncbi:MAG: hypothetical protein IT173_05310 [Acidobacteria bacterium]|nr:hypothetical protein [Acidobacteriota bacterium]